MFGIKYRYVFFLLLAVYSYLNISFTVGEKLFDFYIQPLYLFAILAVVVLGIWELNRLTERKLEKLHALAQQRIHPLIILFVMSMINVVIVSIVCLELLYILLNMPLHMHGNHLTLLMAFGFRVNLFLNCLNTKNF